MTFVDEKAGVRQKKGSCDGTEVRRDARRGASRVRLSDRGTRVKGREAGASLLQRRGLMQRAYLDGIFRR